ncbi:alanine/glycine:cation symporter family protein [Corynebacterium cystitidis]|uniref:Alanine or glycine:cation symporter, AGCS family n=1 Tax=Corynebacterium cystitidis DSM 20524 TaxID=1121357 RepID=A0A1H9NW06_9CORY|nr:alanine/glycine:cation symporter family protein [Corynebacterium cystitidis]WJY82708.1 Amino-acid carrier protein AlsT [Corynebacterium cystitidis DSM 20524]SER40130.1 alanine or glycine:cation symporter, AGCS family [Corynebacterium cystitidis DSM 20524]SNV71540.1 putative amino acid carrier protein [Corynebacterium cystitidis]
MEQLENFVTSTINDNLWMVVPWVLIAAGIYFGIRTIVVQVRMLPDMFKAIIEKPGGAEKSAGGISAFKAFTISAASRVGTGNVAGVAVAISLGGPGAVFWMWLIAIVGGATSFVESTLAQLWKTKDEEGNYHGGPAYYMTRGLGWTPLAMVFAVFLAVTYGFVYNAIQTNSIVESVGTSFEADSLTFKLIVGGLVALLTASIIFGGVTRVASATQIIVPFMAGAYIIMGAIVLIVNISEIPGMFVDIVSHALGFKEIAGATLGAAFMNGVRRGLFSNEAGMGSAPNAAATATVSHPVKQGLVQTLGVYFDTIVVCSITAFIILLGPQPMYGEEVQGASLTQVALADSVGDWAIHFVSFILFFLAFSSIIGNYYLAQANIEYLTNSKLVMNIFRVAVIGFVFFGAVGSIPLVWALGDTFAACLVFINLLAIVPLGGVAIKLLKNYSEQRAAGIDPVFHKNMIPELRNVETWDGSNPVNPEI